MSEISANDLVDLVREVENDVKVYLTEILTKFKADTGFSIDSMWVEFTNVTTTGSTHPEYIINKVDCGVAWRE